MNELFDPTESLKLVLDNNLRVALLYCFASVVVAALVAWAVGRRR